MTSDGVKPPQPRQRWLVVGAGSFGTAFAHILGQREVELTLAARSAEHVAAMQDSHTNERYFPGERLPDRITICTIDDAVREQWDVIVLAVPTSAFTATLERFRDCTPTFVSLAKGLDPSGRRLSEAAADIIDLDRFVALSGPNIAREIIQDLPTAAVLAGTDVDRVLALQQVINGITFRTYANPDLVGVELAGATKNVVAIAAGVLKGAGFGDNGVAAVMTRGLGEMARLGLAYGANLQTYLGLAGVGDLMTTCASPHSRNNRAGQLLAKGLSAEQVRAEIGQVVEGLRTAPIVREMGRAKGLQMNVCEAMADIAEHDVPLTDVARRVMSRPPQFEFATDHEFVAR